MARERRDFVRRSGFRDASLVVIACEGAVTEPEYFEDVKARLHAPGLHVEFSNERTWKTALLSASCGCLMTSPLCSAFGRTTRFGSFWIVTRSRGSQQ
jgi:hypothetical protein